MIENTKFIRCHACGIVLTGKEHIETTEKDVVLCVPCADLQTPPAPTIDPEVPLDHETPVDQPQTLPGAPANHD